MDVAAAAMFVLIAVALAWIGIRAVARARRAADRIFREELDDPDRTNHRDDREDAS